MTARIYRPAKTAMQSGKANTLKWLLEFEPAGARSLDRLMGWSGSPDTAQQVRLWFDSCEAAVAFAEQRGLDYQLIEPHEPRLKIRTYADNFRYDRLE